LSSAFRIDDLHAQIHRVTDRPLLVVEVAERNRRFAVAERDRPRFLDFLQRAREFLRMDRQGKQGGRRREHSFGEEAHGILLSSIRAGRDERADAG
jgi:hypothetical protein